MAKFLVAVDVNKNEIQNYRTHNLAAAPSTPGQGQNYFNTTDKIKYYYNGTVWVNPQDRSQHSGTQLASTISDLATTVKAYKLSDFAVPTANIAMNGYKLTGLAAPTAGSSDAATALYVDTAVQSAAAGIDAKASVRVVAVANSALTGLLVIDGITLIAGDRVLLTAQTTASQNGVYIAGSGAWSRATDSDATGEITPGAFWFVEEGTTYGASQWRCANTGTITVGTTSITINQFGQATNYTASNGVQLTGANFSAQVVASGGINTGVSGLSVDRSLVPMKYAVTFGDGTATSYTITHNLNSQDVTVTVREIATNNVVYADVQMNGVNTCVVSFSVAPSTNSLRIVVVG